ncbi:Gfo/Idh/MocA family oxidoreductase [Frondihabitans australicus]|uniref:Myo-inositol 2-dehydrogenase/D-chiro-inositol 1-dehydrogenase n=1 Tax=Frondihabitans australicus TaxID=386892 RepID=A0A495IGV0_9MICO|nr:Gfo/Idh/MocA family oxidoreductase [Frondihabitans australicus]RKR75232.1 myo-inositol 2-dehydrogenase/D-chiro-inositol 1-dehydrogenase [Frondihabitans australicus]
MQRFALIGAGFIGTVHAQNLAAHPGIEFVGIHDVAEARAQELAARFGTRSLSAAEVFDPATVDAVFIASSTDTHAVHLRSAADAGLAVMCEKPIAPDLAEARAVVDYVTASGVPAMLDFNRRYDRDHAGLQRVVRKGGVGAVELVQMSTRGPSLPPIEYLRVSGGQMADQTVHFFDLLRWITGQEPVSVAVQGSALVDPSIAEFGDVDTSVATLTLESGAIVEIDSVRRTGYGYDERIEVMGSTGLVESRRNRTSNVAVYGAGAVTEAGLHPGWFERVQPTYALALAAFVEALEAGHPAPATLEDGLRAQAIAEAATRALRSGRTEAIEY